MAVKNRRSEKSVETRNATVPRWVRVIAGLIAALGIYVAGTLYFAPQTVLTGVDTTTKGVQFLAFMWAARQLAIALALGYCAFRGTGQLLALALSIYVIMNIQDALIGVQQANTGLIIGAVFFGVLAAVLAVVSNSKE